MMTTQQALEILKERNSYAKGFGEAFDLAVSALEEKASGKQETTSGKMVLKKIIMDTCKAEIAYIDEHWLDYKSPSEAQEGYRHILRKIKEMGDEKI